MKLKVDLFSQS